MKMKVNEQLWIAFVTVATVSNIWIIGVVNGDVSSLKSVKVLSSRNGRQQSTSAPGGDNSNSFSILTKEFLNRPENATNPPSGGGDANKNPTNSRNLAPFPMLRINGIDVNGLAENDDSDEQSQGYVYDKPKIPFEAEDGQSTNTQSSTIAPQREEEPYDGSQGYSYPRPKIPFPLPSNSPDSDAETLPGASARSIKG